MLFRKINIFVFFICVLTFFVYPEEFVFKYQKDIKYKMLTTVNEDVYENNQFSHNAEFFNKIAIEIAEVKDKSGFLKGVFQVSSKVSSKGNLYKLFEEYYSEFWRDELGHYSSVKKQLMPLSRDIPLFPGKNLSPGDSWEAPGEEIYDFREFGIRDPLHAPVTVNYVYIKNETRKGVKCAVFKIFYNVSVSFNDYSPLRTTDIPIKIIGNSSKVYYWDIKNGRPSYYSDKFDIIYLLLSGNIIEFKGTSEGEVTESQDLDLDDVTEKIEKMIEEENIEDMAVEKEDDGVKIILEDINFLPDSDILLPGEQEKLKKLASILKQFPDKDLFISGHTALAGTEEGRQILSEKRARAVGEFLLSIGARKETQMIFKGFGARLPRADNMSPGGMKKNRRVEIKILEN